MDMTVLKTRVRDGAAPFLILLLANVVVFHDYWTAERIFTGKDLLTAFLPLLNFQTDCLQELSLPLWNPYLNFGYPFVEHYSNTMLFPTHLLMGLVTGSTLELIQRELLFWTFLGGLGTYLCARELGRSRTAAVAAGLAYQFCGQVVALPHWHLLVYNAACFPFLLLGYHRARRRDAPLSVLSVLFLAFSILGGHITTTVLSIYLFGAYVLVDSLLERRLVFGVTYLAVTVLAAFLLTLPKLAPMVEALRSGPRMLAPASLHTKDPFNVVNLYQFMSMLLPVKYFFSLYIGQLSLLALAFAAVRRKLRFDALLALFLLTAWLLMVDNEGDVSFLRSAANLLPFMKLVRNEWFEWFHPSLFAILYLSRPVEEFLSERFGRDHIAAAVLFGSLLAACFLLAFNTAAYAGAFWVHVALAGLFITLPLFKDRDRLQFAAAAMLVTVECFLVFSRVSVDEPPRRNATQIQVAVIDQGSVSRSYRDSNRAASKFYAVAVQDRFRPSVSESRERPVLISGLDGDPAYNMYPEQYGKFIDFMNLKRFGGWWYNAQERFDFIRLKDSPLLAQMEGLPLYALFDAATARQSDNAAVTFDRLSCSSFVFTVEAPLPSFFLLHQMFDERWSVHVDNGPPQRPVLAGEFFMGLPLDPGRHVVRFTFSEPLFTWSLAVSILTLAVLCILGVRQARRTPEAAHAG